MIKSNWVAKTAGALLLAVPLLAFSARPMSVPDRSRLLQNSILAGNCVAGPGALICASFSASSGYDRLTGTVSNTYFDLNETRYLSDGGSTLRYISCSVQLTTLRVDRNGATLAETLLDPASPDCYTFGYSLINDVYDPSFGGFQSALHVSGAFSSPQFVNSGNQVSTRVDKSTGSRFSSSCTTGSGENMLQGGFVINGDFYATDGGLNSQGVASYSKCVFVSR